MNNYEINKYHRKSIRLQGYDYSQKGMYFITICVKDKECIFGSISNGEMILNNIGHIVAHEWRNTSEIRDNVAIHDFIIMPNHLHGIIEITYNKNNQERVGDFISPKETIGSIIRGFKITTIKKIKDLIDPVGKNSHSSSNGNSMIEEWIINHLPQIWQRNYYEHIIRDYDDHQRIANYINTNPLRWDVDVFNH